ncbi:MAG: lipocalin family protein [Bacteroidia bacterium]|nr:lipocalin family protein [Bacteroidia bacterium]MDW8015105.1 lipocalin family protein [Bacteroidia bacterium]
MWRRVVLSVIFFWACEPDKPAGSSVSPTVSERLSGGGERVWRLQTISIRGSSQAVPPCRSDDRWTFRSDQTASLQNPSACIPGDPDDPPAVSGRWRLSNADRFLIVEGSGFYMSREIIQLTDRQLVWEYTGSEGELIQESWVP